MIGKSLSLCVQAILRGDVAEADVEYIIAGTKAKTPLDFAEVVNDYCKVYWKDFSAEAIVLAWRLWDAGKLDQPRLRGEAPPNLSNSAGGIWWDASYYSIGYTVWVTTLVENTPLAETTAEHKMVDTLTAAIRSAYPGIKETDYEFDAKEHMRP